MSNLSFAIRRKGWQLFKNNKVKVDMITDKRIYFTVKGSSEDHTVIYYRDSGELISDCKYFSLHLKPCSHIYACNLFFKEKLGFKKI